MLENFPDVKNEMLNIAKLKRERYYEIIVQRNLPMPERTLDVYGVPNLNSEESRKFTLEPSTRKNSLANEENSRKTGSKTQLSKNKSKRTNRKDSKDESKVGTEVEAKPKPRLNVPESNKINVEKLDLAQSHVFNDFNKAIDAKIDLHQNFSSNIPEDAEVTEEDIVKLLKNYNEDMELINLSLR